MAENQQVSAFPLPPKQYVDLYTDENVKRNRVPAPPPIIQVSDFFYLRILHLLHIILSLGCKVFFQRVPGCNCIADLSLKIVFWTHNFAVGLNDMGNRESQDP